MWDALKIVAAILSAVGVPGIVGVVILLRYRDDPVSQMAGVFTLKPLVATPLWLVLVFMGGSLTWDGVFVLLLISAIGLTLLIVLAFRQALTTDALSSGFLLVADTLRWLNTLACVGEFHGGSAVQIYMIAALILPSAYAVMALVLVNRRSRQRQRLAQAPV